MNSFIRKLVVFIGILFVVAVCDASTSDGNSKLHIQVQGERTVYILGSIVTQSFVDFSGRVSSLRETEGPLYILLNSFGGDMVAATGIIGIIETLKAEGRIVACIGGPMVQSAAFAIFNVCTHRYIFENSMVLAHPTRWYPTSSMNAKDAQGIAANLKQFDEHNLRQLTAIVGMSPADAENWFWSNRPMTARELVGMAPKWAQVIREVKGINPFAVTQPRQVIATPYPVPVPLAPSQPDGEK